MNRTLPVDQNQSPNNLAADRRGQLSLWADPPATTRCPHNGAATSRTAAQSVAPRAVGQAARILSALAEAGDAGLTRHELAERLGLPLSSVCGRVNQLVRSGQAIEHGDTRMSPYGHRAAVLHVAETR
jgi:hypothetical protein